MSGAKRERNLKIHRLHNRGWSARQISEAVGMSHRQVQRILAEMKAEYEGRFRRLTREADEACERGRARALELLDRMKEKSDEMVDLLSVHDLRPREALPLMLRKDVFDHEYLELRAMLELIPDARGGKGNPADP
jgi:IS30 family transposase